MAGREPSIPRRRVLGGAAALSIAVLIPDSALPTPALLASRDRRLWNRRLARYRRLATLAEEAATTGWFRAANDRHGRDVAEVEARFGGWEQARRSAQGKAFCRAIWQRMDAAEDAYWDRCTDPMQKAAVALALTPAPDLEGLRTKIALMRKPALEGLDLLPRHPLDVLLEDLERFA